MGLLSRASEPDWIAQEIAFAIPRRLGLAMGLNEFAGYLAVAGSALVTGWIAARYALRPEPFYLAGLSSRVANMVSSPTCSLSDRRKTPDPRDHAVS